MERTSNKIFICVLALIGIGLVMIYSTSALFAQTRFLDEYFFIKKQLLWVAIGMGVLFTVYRLDLSFWENNARIILFISILLLLCVHIPSLGKTVGGAKRWIQLGGFTFQPSELAKFSLVLYLSSWLSNHQKQIKSFWGGFVPLISIISFVLGVIILHPDLGTTVTLGVVSLILLFVGGVRIRYLLTLLMISIPLLYFSIFNVAYRKARILSFLNPWEDPQGKGFQIIQSFIALGSGGWFGVGLGQSRQKLFYLPEAHTDFIFSILGEELGFVGAFFVCALFISLLILGYRTVLKSKDLFSQFFGLGIITLIALQAIMNIGVVTGSFPTKGLPLPFISFGGSSLVMNMLGIGILMQISRRIEQSKRVKKVVVRKRKVKGRVFFLR